MVHFLSLEEVQKAVPSAFAESHDGLRSERYNFVSTRQIIDSMQDNGWGVVAAKAPKARLDKRKAFGMHKLEFQDRNIADEKNRIRDPRFSNYYIYPRVHIMNSHNGTSMLTVMAGLYCVICSNGLIISMHSVGEFRVRHNNQFNSEDAFATIGQFRNSMNNIVETIEKWSSIDLSHEKSIQFATRAARIRWPSPEVVIPDPLFLLNARREEDKGSSLWHRFNVVQENLIQGGFSREKRKVRQLSQIREDLRINTELWDLAREYSEEVLTLPTP